MKTKLFDYDRHLDQREARRLRAEERWIDRMDALERKAQPLIGELQGEKGHRYYINLRDRQGRLTGRIKESTSESDLIAYLIRNRYV